MASFKKGNLSGTLGGINMNSRWFLKIKSLNKYFKPIQRQRNILPFLFTIILLLSAGAIYTYAWTGPGQAPPGGNADAPVNIGNIGQIKGGGLSVGANLTGDDIGLLVLNGRLGIGAPSPQGTLDVNGAIYQRGVSLHADYVFEPGYQLDSIDEGTQYMWQNKHLKAIPEAKYDENGQQMIEMGANYKGLLEELEKAHIYIQQLNDRVKSLEVQIGELQER